MVELLEKDLVFRIIGCAMAVHNELGHGLREETYENSLALEFKYQGIEYSKQTRFPVYYRNEAVDEFIPDLVVEKRVIVDTKTVETIIDEHRGTMLNYLKITGLKVGLIINYKHRKLEWERLVLDDAR
ncbi:GxxExxY protein [candidate division KSB1 bacterium]|nr:GxxExxY protein [candidate division KSB1 bacterium]